VQEYSIYKALFLKELLLNVKGCNFIIVIIIILIYLFFSLTFFFILDYVSNSFTLREVYREVCRQLYVCKVIYRKELYIGSLTLFVYIVS
jgi:hypothetical protein